MSHHMSLHLPWLARHLWLHIWCWLDRCAFIGPYLFVTHITYATTNANTCIQKCINKFTHMHQHMHKFLLCENRILFYVITLNKTLFSQNKTLCICWCIYLQIYLHIHLHLLRILHLFQHLQFVSVHLQTYM
jgi:hypothetical protein